jgi:Undecaprenyl-phosphate galactose phosphotransferase, WbaP/exopolysaccharide biosynthesis polyprenyl glycosylphosphotransferase
MNESFVKKQVNKKQNRKEASFLDYCASYIMPIILLVSDYIAVLLAEGTAFFLRKNVIPLYHEVFDIPDLYFYVLVPGVFLVFLYYAHTHIRRMPFWEIVQQIFYATLYSMLVCISLMYLGGVAGVVSRLYVGMVAILAFFFICLMRYNVKRILNKLDILQEPVIFIGAGKTAELVLRFFANDTGFGYRVIGIIDDNPVSQILPQRFRILGGVAQAERLIRASNVQNVIITAPGLERDALLGLINRIQPYVKNISFVPDLIGAPVGNIEVERLFDEKIMLLKMKNNLVSKYNRLSKRLFDITLSVLGLVLVVPLLFIIMVCIYMDSPGKVVFAHKRVGQQGKYFSCYKFRTMVPNAEQVLQQYLADNPAAREEWLDSFKLKNDPRVTRVGEFLRKTSLDELPQIWNVIKGEMSLVGPRPIVEAEIERYGEYIHDYYLVPPGITGMWQVNGRSDTTYPERVAMDVWYVRNWSVWIDLIYLFKTVKIVLERKGAY